MTKDQAPHFFKRLAAMSELFDAKFSEVKAELYFDALKDLDIEDVIRALNESVRTKKFMPRPAEIRELAIGDEEDNTERAWLEWKTAARRTGSYEVFHTDDAALSQTLVHVFGGWPEACTVELSPAMWASKRKEFGRVYRVMQARGVTGYAQLPGIFQRQIDGTPFSGPQRLTNGDEES